MKKIELEELKKIALDILKDVAKFCDENNIRYYLAYGTLLGAIRHKGFIPWDDDIDIMMPRPDYNRFIQLFNAKNKNKELYILSLETNVAIPYTFTKIVNRTTIVKDYFLEKNFRSGVCIDIFPIDGLPSDVNESSKHMRKQKILHLLVMSSSTKLFYKRNNKFRTIFGPFVSLIGRFLITPTVRNKLQLKIKNNFQKYNFENSDFVGINIDVYTNKARFLRKIFDESIEVEFESEMFKAPKGYHEYLTHFYGDYMTPPPLKERTPKHDFEAYWKDK